MLLSTITSSIISSSAISSSAISMLTTPGLPQYGATVTIGLIALLSLKEVLSASEKWNKYLNNSFNLAIAPLLFSFAAIVFFKVLQIIWLSQSQMIPGFSSYNSLFHMLFICFLCAFCENFKLNFSLNDLKGLLERGSAA